MKNYEVDIFRRTLQVKTFEVAALNTGQAIIIAKAQAEEELQWLAVEDDVDFYTGVVAEIK